MRRISFAHRLISSALTLLMLITMSNIVYADDELSKPIIIIEEQAEGIPEYAINEIIMDNPDAAQITITSWVEPEEPPLITPFYFEIINVVLTTLRYDVVAQDVFVTSAAKGMEKTLATKWTSSLKSTATGGSGAPATPSSLGIEYTVTKEYSTTIKWAGPPESSPYNSREFKVRFYQNEGTWTGLELWSINQAYRKPVSGIWTRPSKYAEYAIDKNITYP